MGISLPKLSQTRSVNYVVGIEVFLARAFNFNFNSGERGDDVPWVLVAELQFQSTDAFFLSSLPARLMGSFHRTSTG